LTTSISISQIKYVLALANTGSFSKAADLCFVTQSTLSTMIMKMENQLDLKLFDRKSKPISLTQEGIVLIDQFKVISNEYENLKELIQRTKGEFHGTLKIGIIPTLAPFLLPLFLNNLITRYPDINFSISEITTQEIVNKIRLRELDIGILSLPLDEKGLQQKSLFKEEFLIYDTRENTQQNKKYKINDIDINRLWLLEESHCLTNQIEKICQLRKMRKSSQNLIFNSGSILSLLELVNMNKGLTLLPKLATLHKNLINPKFVYHIENPIPVREVGVVTHANFAKKRLLNILEKEIQAAVEPVLDGGGNVRVVKPF
jgi:LysR family hydrogen peroxide-inducible transcriptional activator